jgi:hypothetical protein
MTICSYRVLARAHRVKTLRALLALAATNLALTACGDDDTNAPAASKADAAHNDAGRSDASPIAADAAASRDAATAMSSSKLSFFVSSQTNDTGDLGGLSGADARCQKLATAAGAGAKTWHAYLSVEKGPNGDPVDARDRIGKGPWYNAKGALLAEDSTALHARTGDADLFLDETGAKINGQWTDSPPPVEHDVLTGSTNEGTLLAGKTCADWTSTDPGITAQVGHTDGLGPNHDPTPPYSSWNSAHENGGCNDTKPRGGAGRIYCFAIE